MQNIIKPVVIIALVAVMALSVAEPVQAGGVVDRVFNGGAKSLAKQAQNLIKQAAALQEKALVIEEKALALSDRDRRTYQAELERLGFQPPEWLFNDAQALLTGAPPAPEGPGGILGFIGGLFGGNRNSGARGNTTAPPDETAAAPSSTAPATTPTTAPASTASGSGGTFTLTGIPSQYNGKYAMISGGNATGTINIVGAQILTLQGLEISATFVPIRSGRVVLNLYVGTLGRMNRYTASDTLDMGVIITDQASVGNILDLDFDMEVMVGFENVSFRNGSAERAWSAGKVEVAPPIDRAWTWTAVADSTFDRYDINAIAWGNNRFIAGGENGKMAYSADGARWTAIADNMFTSERIYDIAYGNNRFVAVGGYGGEGRWSAEVSILAYSADGVTWTALDIGSILGTFTNMFGYAQTYDINAIAWGNNRFVIGGDGGKMAYSSDGARWTAVSDSRFGDSTIAGIAFGNNRFVAVGSDGKIAYSTNGQSWTAVSDSTFGNSVIVGVAWGNNRFVAGGQSGKMAYSSDGVRWTAIDVSGIFGAGSSSGILAIAYGNNRFIAGDTGGTIAYSADGVSWTAVANSTFDTRNPINAVAYGNGRFVVGGNDGKMAYADW